MYYVAWIIIILIFIWRIITGFKKGMVQELISLVAMVIGCICLTLILTAVSNYLNKQIGQTLQSLLTLAVICLVYRLVSVIFTSLKLISKLPVISILNKLLGAVTGAVEALLLVSLLVALVKKFGMTLL